MFELHYKYSRILTEGFHPDTKRPDKNPFYVQEDAQPETNVLFSTSTIVPNNAPSCQ